MTSKMNHDDRNGHFLQCEAMILSFAKVTKSSTFGENGGPKMLGHKEHCSEVRKYIQDDRSDEI